MQYDTASDGDSAFDDECTVERLVVLSLFEIFWVHPVDIVGWKVQIAEHEVPCNDLRFLNDCDVHCVCFIRVWIFGAAKKRVAVKIGLYAKIASERFEFDMKFAQSAGILFVKFS